MKASLSVQTARQLQVIFLAIICFLLSAAAQEKRDPRESFLQQARQTPATPFRTDVE